MGKLVVLKFGDGSFEKGFSVTLQIAEGGRTPHTEVTRSLPPAPEIPLIYHQWQVGYRSLGLQSRISAPAAQVTNVSLLEECQNKAQNLKDRLNIWLRQGQFLDLRERVLEEVKRSDLVQVVVQTQDMQLRRLPWHLWDLFERYPKAEIVLSAPDYDPYQSKPLKNKVKILTILGSSEGIDVQADRTLLQQLKGAEITLLEKPTLQEFNDRLWRNKWDILFFAGHSSTPEESKRGHIQINNTESLTIEQLKYALQTAVENGLQLAIFNSCDGLGLARDLACLQIPRIIVMREPVPDPVAQTFLKYFLEALAGGELFYLAVRKARERLQGMETDFPCATWLPVICQKPTIDPLVWPKANSQVKMGLLAGVAIASIGLLGIAASFFRFPPNSQPISPNSLSEISPGGFSGRFSWGNRILITAGTTPEAEAGVKALAAGNFATAIPKFQAALQSDRNNPETLIYLNNAIAANAGRTLRIATSVPIGGNLNIAKEMLRGVAQAQDEVNRNGGINGALLQVEIANDDNDPETGKQIAAKFVKDSLILAAIGHNASEVSILAAPVYQRGGLVMISPTSNADELSNNGNYIFRTVPSNFVDAVNLSKYAMKTARRSKFAICIDSRSPYSESMKKAFTKAVEQEGGKVSSLPCDFAEPTFNPGIFISSAIADGADSLLLAPSIERINHAIDVAKATKGRLALFGVSRMYAFETLQLGQADVNNMVLAVVWHPSTTQGNFFHKKAIQLWGGAVNWRSAMAYDATIAIIEGLKQNNSRQGLQKVLSNPSFAVRGATETVRFLPSGERAITSEIGILVKVQPVPGSQVGYDFIPVQP